MAGARAHNRWLAELCRTSPERRAGVAIVPVYDVEAALAEIRRARESGLRGGILIPSMWQPYPPYHDPCYEPVWATCWFVIWAGVFDRHPDLRFVVTECGAFWAPDLLWTMDTVYDRDHGSRKLGEQLTANLARRPSEVFDARGLGPDRR